MSYDISKVERYTWAEDATFAATAVTHNIMGPKGKVGFVKDISVEVTTSLVGTTSVPEVMVGISSGDFTYGRYRLGTGLTTGYGTGVHRASMELITGNPPRVATDFASHVVLDGGPFTSQGIAGGSYGTVVPTGRIPAGPLQVTNVINGAGNVPRIFLNGLTPAPGGLSVGQKVLVQGIAGATGSNGLVSISAIDTTAIANGGPAWIETSGTFGGTYTSGGLVVPQICVTLKANGAGSGAGGGIATVEIEWVGTNVSG